MFYVRQCFLRQRAGFSGACFEDVIDIGGIGGEFFIALLQWAQAFYNDLGQGFLKIPVTFAGKLGFYFFFFGGGVKSGPLAGAVGSWTVRVSLVWAMVRRFCTVQ